LRRGELDLLRVLLVGPDGDQRLGLLLQLELAVLRAGSDPRTFRNMLGSWYDAHL
jgi:hypothetical protein